MEESSETKTKKPKRLTSVVWNHFERVKKGDVCYAVCVHCKKKLSGSSRSGTTHLRNHLLRCLKRSNHDVSQILSAKRKRTDSDVSLTNLTFDTGLRKDEILHANPISYRIDEEDPKKEEGTQIFSHGSAKFDQERSEMDLARMIMLHGYPLAIVEHAGFKIFAKNLQPLFEVSCDKVELDCMKIYGKEKQKVYVSMHNLHSKISLDVGMWFSSDNARYLCLTANYIDMDWNLRKRKLNFVTLDPSDTDDILSEVVINCVTDWAIDQKLFSMTLDDCPASDDIVSEMKDWISQIKPLPKNGELFDVRCATYVLKSIAQDAIESLAEVVDKVRASIRHVKSSQAMLTKFNELSQQVEINTKRLLVLDFPMQWNSTYSMLEAAVEFRDVFSTLQEHDSSYTTSLSETEWERVTGFTEFMKLFVEVTTVFVGNKYPTSNIYFPELCDIHSHLIEWCENSDEILSSLAVKMKTKFESYWTKCIKILAIAAILDPRFKMKLVEFYYPQIYDCDAQERIKEVSNDFRELYNEYALDQDSTNGSSLPSTSSSSSSRDRLKGFDRFLHETSQSKSTTTSDLDKYLAEPVFPRSHDFNILNWWKVHTPRYPVLSLMARDVLGIPIATLDKDLAFCNGDRVLDSHRSSLNPDAREALICGQDWLKKESEDLKSTLSHPASSITMESS